MSYEEQQLRGEYAAAAEQINVPPILDQRIRNSYQQFLQEKKEMIPVKNKKRWLAAVVVASLLVVPSGTFAYGYLTDDVYGSFDNFSQIAKYATQSTYMQFGMKLSGAKKELGAAEYDQFIHHLKRFNAFRIKYGTSFHIDADTLTPAQYQEDKQLRKNLQPYFDRLNHEKSSSEVFTPEEYDRYLDADITYDTIYAKTGVSDRKSIDVNELPENLRDRFLQAQQTLKELNKKKELPQPLTPWMQQAKGKLSADEFTRFQAVLNRTSELRSEYGAKTEGHLDYDKVSSGVREEMKKLNAEDQMYRDKIAGGKVLKDTLSPAQYDELIEDKMTQETVMAQSGMGPDIKPGNLPNDLRDRYEAADAKVQQYLNMR